MEVEIEKQLGTISIEFKTLSYSGETLVSDDSKIERTGSWRMEPTGEFDQSRKNLNIDADITVQNDVQRIYAKNNSGNWIVVNEINFSGFTPDSDLTFNVDDAVLHGSIVGVSTGTGSIIWTLVLAIVPE